MSLLISYINKILDKKSSRINEIIKEKTLGKKVLGWLCTYTPEELIHAAGIIPYRIFKGGEEEPTTSADTYLQRNLCPFARACLGYALNGQYDFLDGIASTHTCDAIHRLPYVWEKYDKKPFFFQLDLPRVFEGGALNYFKKEIIRFKRALEQFSGNEITDDKLTSSINIYNKTRSLLKQIYKLRKAEHPPISGTDLVKIVQAVMTLERESSNELLDELKDELEKNSNGLKIGPRILFTGSIIADGDYKVLDLIEGLGGLIVADDLCTGSRYFWDLVDNSKSPMDAISERYFLQIPCPRMKSVKKRLDHVLNLAKDYKINGVVYYNLKFCETFQYDYPIFKKELEERGFPILRLDTDYSELDIGQLKTRIEAFLEML